MCLKVDGKPFRIFSLPGNTTIEDERLFRQKTKKSTRASEEETADILMMNVFKISNERSYL